MIFGLKLFRILWKRNGTPTSRYRSEVVKEGSSKLCWGGFLISWRCGPSAIAPRPSWRRHGSGAFKRPSPGWGGLKETIPSRYRSQNYLLGDYGWQIWYGSNSCHVWFLLNGLTILLPVCTYMPPSNELPYKAFHFLNPQIFKWPSRLI